MGKTVNASSWPQLSESPSKGIQHGREAVIGMAGSASDCHDLRFHLRAGLLMLLMSREPSFLINDGGQDWKTHAQPLAAATGSRPQTDRLQVRRHNWMWALGSQLPLGHNRDLTWSFNPNLIFSITIFILYLKTCISFYSALCYTDWIFLFPFWERAVHQEQRAAWITYFSSS